MREKRGKFVGGSWLGAFLLWAADCVCVVCVRLLRACVCKETGWAGVPPKSLRGRGRLVG